MNDLVDKDSYRRDVRNPNEFACDIKDGAVKEKLIIERFAEIVGGATITDNGCDNSGKWIPAWKVNTKADYRLNGHPIEVKFSNHKCNIFRFKVSQVRDYVLQGASMLFVNGVESDCPEYIWVSVEQMKSWVNERVPEEFWGWGNKLVYKFFKDEFEWKPFKKQ